MGIGRFRYLWDRNHEPYNHMSEIGSKVVQFRKIKNLSQEALAEKSGLNLRTVQRVEKGDTVPRGDTIRRLCTALEIKQEELVEWQQVEDRGYLTALNLSALTFLIIPLLGIIVPLILWIYKKDKVLNAREIGRKVLNFQIIWNILFYLYHFLFVGYFFLSTRGKGIIADEFTFKIGVLTAIYVSFYLINGVLIIVNAVTSYRDSRIAMYPAIPILR